MVSFHRSFRIQLLNGRVTTLCLRRQLVRVVVMVAMAPAVVRAMVVMVVMAAVAVMVVMVAMDAVAEFGLGLELPLLVLMPATLRHWIL